MRVVNLRKEKYDVYIGRESLYENPFRIGRDGTREDVIKKFEYWIRREIRVNIMTKADIYEIPKDAILGCYCKPKACHGDVIIKIWKELHAND